MKALNNSARKKFSAYLARQAELNHVDNDVVLGGNAFAIAPSVEQKIESKIQESSGFLARINIVGVTEQEGEKLGLGISGTLASRTNTDNKDRITRDPGTLDNDRYCCEQTNFDTHIKYQKVDMWAKFADFQTRMTNQIVQRIALDRLMIGFNGKTVALDSDPTTNPLLSDVNIGWLEKYRKYGTDRVLVDCAKVGDINAATHYYLRAVYHFSKSKLVESYKDYDTTRADNKRSEMVEMTSDYWLQQGRACIAWFYERNRYFVELV